MSANQKQRNKVKARNTVSVSFTTEGWEDYSYWRDHPSYLDTFTSINALIAECLRTPFKGTGKPEPLKGDLTGFWSRRITREHRLVYFFEEDRLTILQCRFHYSQ